MMLIKPVTRSHKANDRHGSRSPEAQNSPPDTSHLPHYFAKRGPVNGDPTKVKKNGGGRGNWYVLSSSLNYAYIETCAGTIY